jgi:hypothetical protein
MRNLSVAEAIVGSFTDPAMASSIVGDLAELRQKPSTFWFSVWTMQFRTKADLLALCQ